MDAAVGKGDGEDGLEMRDANEVEPNLVDESKGIITCEPAIAPTKLEREDAGFCSTFVQYCCSADCCCVDDAT